MSDGAEIRKELITSIVDRMVAEGATDDEILDAFPRPQAGVAVRYEPFQVYLTTPERRFVESHLHERRRAWREIVDAYWLADEKNRETARVTRTVALEPRMADVVSGLPIGGEALRLRLRKYGLGDWPATKARIKREALHRPR